MRYKISSRAIDGIRKRTQFMYLIPLGLMSIFAVLYFLERNSIDYSTFRIVMVLSFVILFAFFINTINTVKRWESFELIINQNCIERTMKGRHKVSIEYSHIMKVTEEVGNGLAIGVGLLIRTEKPNYFIFIPKGLDAYDDVKLKLQKYMLL